MLAKRLCIVPYKRYSEGARILARKLGIHRLPSPDLVRGGHHVINWGNTAWEVPVAAKVYNRPEKVAVAVNKKLTYEAFKQAGVLVPDFTTSMDEARAWCEDGKIVLCRTLLSASGGKGIVVAEKPVDIVPAKVYTRYVRKKREYRVHVFQGRVIGYKRKIKHKDIKVKDDYIRSHDNGYRYIVDPANPPSQGVLAGAVAAVNSLGLDFGGADMAWLENGDKAYCLEVNCAPGMTEMTANWYVEAIMKNYAL